MYQINLKTISKSETLDLEVTYVAGMGLAECFEAGCVIRMRITVKEVSVIPIKWKTIWDEHLQNKPQSLQRKEKV